MPQSLNSICPILQEHYCVNITVHETRSDLDYIIQQYPQEYDHDLPCIDIHQQVNANGIGHVSLINPKMYAYKTKYGLQCKFCKVRTQGQNYRRKCSTFNGLNCPACHRIGLPNAIITKNSINTYCDFNCPKDLQILSQDKRFELGPIKCPEKNCSMTVYSAFCLKGHKTNVCKRKHQCNDCNSVLTIGGTKDKKTRQS